MSKKVIEGKVFKNFQKFGTICHLDKFVAYYFKY